MIRADIGSVSANTQGCNIGMVSEGKRLYWDTPRNDNNRKQSSRNLTWIE